MTLPEMCHCGKPLHYTDPSNERLARKMIAMVDDPYVTVIDPNGVRWRVQRHYIALHGLKGADIPRLGFERLAD